MSPEKGPYTGQDDSWTLQPSRLLFSNLTVSRLKSLSNEKQIGHTHFLDLFIPAPEIAFVSLLLPVPSSAMPYAEISADQGFLLQFAFAEDLASRVVARNNKAALFGTLEALAKIQGCIAVYWGTESGNRKRIVLVAGESQMRPCQSAC